MSAVQIANYWDGILKRNKREMLGERKHEEETLKKRDSLVFL